MSDENETNNPYQPPTLSDEPLAKKDADAPKAKPHVYGSLAKTLSDLLFST